MSATFHRKFTKTCKSFVLKNNWESQLKQIHIKGFLYILSWMNRLKTSIHNSPSINEVHWRGIMVQFFSQLIFLSPSHKKTVFSKVFQRFSIWSHWSKHWISPMCFFLPLLPLSLLSGIRQRIELQTTILQLAHPSFWQQINKRSTRGQLYKSWVTFPPMTNYQKRFLVGP